MKAQWDRIIQSLVLIRLGQELGSNGKLASLIHDVIDSLLRLVK